MVWELVEAAAVSPAIASGSADATGRTGVMRAATTTSSVNHTIPSALKGHWVRLLSKGASTQYVVVLDGTTAPTLVYNQTAALGTGHVGVGATLVDGTPEHVWIPRDAKQITVISDGAAGFFELHGSSNNAPGRRV